MKRLIVLVTTILISISFVQVTYAEEATKSNFVDIIVPNLSVNINKSIKSGNQLRDNYLLNENIKKSIQKPLTSDQTYWKLGGIEELNYYLWYASEQTNMYKTYSMVSNKVKVAVLDTGIDLNHTDLFSSISTRNARSYIGKKDDIRDEVGHGTQVAGVINIIMPFAEITPYKVAGKDGGNSQDIIKAIYQAVKDKNNIINISLGSYTDTHSYEGKKLKKDYEKAIKFAKLHDVLVVASVGNEGKDLDELSKRSHLEHLPSSINDVIAVGSTMKNKRIAPYSNTGSQVDFVAPGGYFGENFDSTGEVDVTDLLLATNPTYLSNTPIDKILNIPQEYTLSYGSSLSAAQVSATFAGVQSAYKSKYKKSVGIDKLVQNVKKNAFDYGDSGKDTHFGWGEIQLYQSLNNLYK